MSRPFAVFDIDGTLIRWQLYHATADMMLKLGYVDPDIYASVKEARMDWKRRSGVEAYHNYEKQLVKVHNEVLKTLTHQQFMQAASAVFEQYRDQVYTYTRDLIKQLKTDGYLLFAISGSPAEIVGMIATYYGFDDFLGSVYEWDEQGFTGNITLHNKNKHLSLEQLIKKHAVKSDNSIAVGDSYGDISLMQTVKRPIAFNPDKKLFEAAQQNGWLIVVERKNVVYTLEKDNGEYVLV